MPSSEKKSNLPKNYDNLSSYLNLKDQENMDIDFLRSFEYKKHLDNCYPSKKYYSV